MTAPWQRTVTPAVPLAHAPSPSLYLLLTSRPALLGVSAQMYGVGVLANSGNGYLHDGVERCWDDWQRGIERANCSSESVMGKARATLGFFSTTRTRTRQYPCPRPRVRVSRAHG
ncbi:hypothetical protein BGY98DRAFT_1118886 [Russula aff. rugulosa BPL654]|nr:hypothetical protein BGY98DRAFT_1118886 [Russula aff. rugulosa BPL654]